VALNTINKTTHIKCKKSCIEKIEYFVLCDYYYFYRARKMRTEMQQIYNEISEIVMTEKELSTVSKNWK
jgi:hypothetical protein